MTEFVGTIFVGSADGLTEEVIAKDAILYYLEVQTVNTTRFFSIPGPESGDFTTQVYAEPGSVNVNFRELDNSASYVISQNDNLQSLRVVIIESNVDTGSKSSQSLALAKLKAAGVDTSDYDAVAEYFGLN